MSFLICEKHGKWEKVGSKVPVNGYICMNRYCPDSFKVFCSNCKNDHRDHSIKVLTIEDVSFLVERLLKAPFKEVARVVGETLDIMKKLKLIKEFRKKIDILEKEVQREALKLIDQTESLIHEYSISKQSVNRLSELFTSIEEPNTYKQFAQSSSELLSNLDYNFKKDKFELGNGLIKEKEDKRRKSVDRAKRKIEEVRDYSMKIIQVILHNDDTEQEEEDIVYQKKHYEVLKTQLCIQKNQKELEDEISELKNSNTTINKSRMRRETTQHETQTTLNIISAEESEQQTRIRIQELKQAYSKQDDEFKVKLKAYEKENEDLRAGLVKEKQKYLEKQKNLIEIQSKLRRNKANRAQKQHIRQEIMGRIIEFSQAKSTNPDEKE